MERIIFNYCIIMSKSFAAVYCLQKLPALHGYMKQMFQKCNDHRFKLQSGCVRANIDVISVFGTAVLQTGCLAVSCKSDILRNISEFPSVQSCHVSIKPRILRLNDPSAFRHDMAVELCFKRRKIKIINGDSVFYYFQPFQAYEQLFQLCYIKCITAVYRFHKTVVLLVYKIKVLDM